MHTNLLKSTRFRDELASCTRADHEALHRHPVLERLSAADISSLEYSTILLLYLGFFARVEQLRDQLSAFEACSLAGDIQHLQRDVGASTPLTLPALSTGSKMECLGMLYVLHGSRLGAGQLHKTLSKALPDQDHHFMGARRDRDLWQALLAEVEQGASGPAGQAVLIKGATTCFRAFGAWMMRAQFSQTSPARAGTA